MSDTFYPELVGLGEEEIKVLAAMGRVAVPDGVVTEMDRMDDRELAASLLRLQEKGYITLLVDSEGNPAIQLNTNPEKARAKLVARQGQRRPSRKERRTRRQR